MSQVFGGDAVNNTASTTVTSTTETVGVTGNFLNPPFGNAKASVSGTVILTVGTGMTSVVVRLRRNPNAENVAVVTTGALTAAAGNIMLLDLQAADVIPDGRPCQYAISVQQAGGAGNGTITFASIAAVLISG